MPCLAAGVPTPVTMGEVTTSRSAVPTANTKAYLMSTPSTQTCLSFPLIHLNGNSRESLLDGYITAYSDLQKAINSFYAIDFHQRNYYPLPPGSWERASAERDAVRAELYRAYTYLERHIEHLSNSPEESDEND